MRIPSRCSAANHRLSIGRRSVGGNNGYTFPVGLSGKALMRFPIAAGRFYGYVRFLRGKTWLAIALLNRETNRP